MENKISNTFAAFAICASLTPATVLADAERRVDLYYSETQASLSGVVVACIEGESKPVYFTEQIEAGKESETQWGDYYKIKDDVRILKASRTGITCNPSGLFF